MIKRIVYIENPSYISTENEQVLINNKITGETKSIPAEDLGYMILDNFQVTISTNAINKIGENGGVVVSCGYNHHPLIFAIPVHANNEQSSRIKFQIKATVPQIKQLWMQIIKSKIKNQTLHLKKLGLEYKTLEVKIEKVQSGDSTHQEGVAAQFYWKTLFREINFKRDPDGDFPNNFLNYGYSIIRATAARALVVSGLHPSIGIFHKNMYNPFCLADDIMEPYRPFVDNLVSTMIIEEPYSEILDRENKKKLLNSMFTDVEIENKRHPLSIGMQITCSSLVDYYQGKIKKIKLPKFC